MGKRIVLLIFAALLGLSSCGTPPSASSSETTETAGLSGNGTYSSKDLNDQWQEADCTLIALSDSPAVTGSGAETDGRTVTITEGGDYLLSGSFSGQVVVDAGKKDDVS